MTQLPQLEEFQYPRVVFTSEGKMEIDRWVRVVLAVMRMSYQSVVVK